MEFLEREFPQIHHGGRSYHLEAVGPLSARMRMDHHERHLRPGGTVSGPAMMALADLALYAAILANIGPVGLAVTTNLNFNFLRKHGTAGLVGEARLIKLGRASPSGRSDQLRRGRGETSSATPRRPTRSRRTR